VVDRWPRASRAGGYGGAWGRMGVRTTTDSWLLSVWASLRKFESGAFGSAIFRIPNDVRFVVWDHGRATFACRWGPKVPRQNMTVLTLRRWQWSDWPAVECHLHTGKVQWWPKIAFFVTVAGSREWLLSLVFRPQKVPDTVQPF